MPRNFDIPVLYLQDLRQLGYISEQSFSTNFSGKDGESFVDFGPYRDLSMSSLEDYVELKVEKNFFYAVTPQGIRFGEKSERKEFALEGLGAVFTTGIHVSLVPSSIAKLFFQHLPCNHIDNQSRNCIHIKHHNHIQSLLLL